MCLNVYILIHPPTHTPFTSRLAERFSACVCRNSQAQTFTGRPTPFLNCHPWPCTLFFPNFMASSINIPFLLCLLIYSSPDKHYPVTITRPLILPAFANQRTSGCLKSLMGRGGGGRGRVENSIYQWQSLELAEGKLTLLSSPLDLWSQQMLPLASKLADSPGPCKDSNVSFLSELK